MQEHSNLYRIFQKDQQEHPMPMEQVIVMLSYILQKYEEMYPSGNEMN